MGHANLGPTGRATQERADNIIYLRSDLADLRARMRQGTKTPAERRALIEDWRRLMRAIDGFGQSLRRSAPRPIRSPRRSSARRRIMARTTSESQKRECVAPRSCGLPTVRPLPRTVGAERRWQDDSNVSLDLPDHPAAALFPLMDKIELEALAANIAAIGQQEAIEALDDGYGPTILIERNRYRACRIAEIEPRPEAYADGWNSDPVGEVIASNRHRKHLTGAQLAWIGFQYTQLNHGEALTQAEAARHTGASTSIRSGAPPPSTGWLCLKLKPPS